MLILAPPGGPLAAADELTLERAIGIALVNNNLLLASEAGRGASLAGVDEARSYLLPQVEIRQTFSRTTNPVMVFGNLLGQESFAPEHFDPAFLNEPPALDNFHRRLQVSQPLWMGGRLRRALETARHALEEATWRRERKRQEVIHGVVDAYTATVLALSRLEVSREALETARAQVKLARDLYEGGLVVRSDLLGAEVRESEIEEMAIQAASGLEVARGALNLAMGLAPDGPAPPPGDIEVAPEEEEEDLAVLTGVARERRPDLWAARERVRTAEEALRLARAGRRPEVRFVGAFEANDPELIGAEGTNWSLMVGARLSVFDGFRTRARIRRAEEELRQAERMRDHLDQAVALDVRKAFHALRAARQRLEQSRRAVGMAAERLRIVEDRYREGLVTWVEVRDAETARTRARTREVSARRDVLLGTASLDLAVGRL